MNRHLDALAGALVAWPRLQLALLLTLGAVLTLLATQLPVGISTARLVAADAMSEGTGRGPPAFKRAESLLVTVRTARDFTDAGTRRLLDTLGQELAAQPGVARVESILDVPLVTLVPGPLARLERNRRTLRDADIDLIAARRELLASPLFHGVLTADEGRVSLLRLALHEADVPARDATLAGLRAVLARHRQAASLGLAGPAALTADARAALQRDMRSLPFAVLAVMALVIGLGTRRPPVLELLCGGYALLTCAGLWQIIVGRVGIAAAALPLVVVFTVSLAFTLRVSYKLHVEVGDGDRGAVLHATVAHALAASLPASGVLALLALTLCLSPLRPLHDLGLLLLLGGACAWLAAFGVGSALLAAVPRRPRELAPFAIAVPARWLSGLLALVLALATVGGVPRFIDEAALSDYLPRASAGRTALAELARHFGGELTFDLTLQLPAAPAPRGPLGEADSGDEAWFSAARLATLRAVHAHLLSLPGIQRVDSLVPLLAVGRDLNDGVELAPFDLNLLYKRLPRTVRGTLVDPYVRPERDALRYEVHVGELPPGLTRAALLARLTGDLEQRFDFARERYRVSGPFVTYAQVADRLPPTLVVLGALGALSSLALVILGGRAPQAASRMLFPALIAALGMMGIAGWRGQRVDLLTVCASGVAFALFVQIRNAGRQLLSPPGAESLRTGTAPPPVRDPYGATVLTLGTVSVAGGLFVLTTAAFPPTAGLGLLCAATVSLAMLASQRVAGRRRRND